MMGFHKRFVNEKIVIDYLKNNNINSLFINTDAIIFEDNISSQVFDLFLDKKTDTEILNIIYNENNQIN